MHIVRHCGLSSCLGPGVACTWYRAIVFTVGSIVVMIFGSLSRRRGRSVVLSRWRDVPGARGRSVSIPSNRRTLFRWRRGNIAVINNLLPVHVACPPRGLFLGPWPVVSRGRVVRPGREASLKNKRSSVNSSQGWGSGREIEFKAPFLESGEVLQDMCSLPPFWPSVMTLISMLLILTPICDLCLDMSVRKPSPFRSSVSSQTSWGGLHFSFTFWLNCFHSSHFFKFIRKHIF